MKITIWTVPLDCGDGSVTVEVHKTEIAAYEAARAHEDEMGVGWGEDCVQSHTIEI